MIEATNSDGIGSQIGHEAMDHGDRHAAEYCAHERQRIEAANQPTILALRAKIAMLQEKIRDLEERILKALPPIEAAMRKRKALGCWAIAALLSVSGFIFAVLTLEPYRLGFKAWLYSLGIAGILPFLVDAVFELWASQKIIRLVVTGACVAALASLVLLSVIRADLLAHQVEGATPAVVFNSDSPVAPQGENSFYQGTVILLGITMVGLALAMEIGSGYAVHQARRWGTDSEEVTMLQNERTAAREEMIECGCELRLKENEGAQWEEQYWRDFSRTKLNGAKSAAQRFSVGLLCLALFAHSRASAADRLNLVAAVDLTASVAAVGPDNKAEFDKNLAAVSRLLVGVPAGASVTVIGVTSQSFSQPYVLLSAELSPDAGYFNERLAAGRNQLLRAWQQKTAQLDAHFKQTDLLGALMVSSQLFRQDGRKNVLVIFSDMRQYTAELDLERPRSIKADVALAAVEKRKLIPDLKGVHVYVLGVDDAAKSLAYWQGLRDFWLAYFKVAGAKVESYSILRELPELGR